jgi:hypothetical protein
MGAIFMTHHVKCSIMMKNDFVGQTTLIQKPMGGGGTEPTHDTQSSNRVRTAKSQANSHNLSSSQSSKSEPLTSANQSKSASQNTSKSFPSTCQNSTGQNQGSKTSTSTSAPQGKKSNTQALRRLVGVLSVLLFGVSAFAAGNVLGSNNSKAAVTSNTAVLPVERGGTGGDTSGIASTNLLGNNFESYAGKLPLASKVSGTLPVGNGGTGVQTLAKGNALIGNDAGALTTSAITSDLTSGSTNLLTSGGGFKAIPLTGAYYEKDPFVTKAKTCILGKCRYLYVSMSIRSSDGVTFSFAGSPSFTDGQTQEFYGAGYIDNGTRYTISQIYMYGNSNNIVFNGVDRNGNWASFTVSNITNFTGTINYIT